MVYLLGHSVEITSAPVCWQGGDHVELAKAARVDREHLGFNINESAVLCMKCAKAVPLKV